MNLYFIDMSSPVGTLRLVASNDALVAVLWENERVGRVRLGKMEASDRHSILMQTQVQLREYFAGKRTSFDLPLRPTGTEFQKKVWIALGQIPYGDVKSYSDIARTLGSPNSARPVGAAIGRNPISIIVPCHRVVGSSGRLTGFAGGLVAKEKLLKLEAQVAAKFG